jgi:putative peptidoglycan lipid II flippase
MNNLKLASIFLLLSTIFLKFSSMIRDLVISGLYGDSYKADAYFAAMTIPNTIILFLLTGMKDAFLPSFYKYDALGKGSTHLTNIVKGTFWISFVVSLLGVGLTPFLIHQFYPNFEMYDEGMDVAIWTASLYFVSIVLVGVNAVYEGYFDAQRKFSFSTFSQTIVAITTIVFALVFHDLFDIYSVPLGYLVGTFLSFCIKFTYMTPRRFLIWKQEKDWIEIRDFYKIFFPIGLTIAVGQINQFVNVLFASRMGEGVVSNLNYAFRLVNIPQAIFGVTIATIIYPSLAKAMSTKDLNQFKRGIEKGLSYMFLLVAPSVAGMMVLMEPIVRIVYERGAFTPETTSITNHFALFYMGSVLFYSIQAVVAKGFYTLEKGSIFMRIGWMSIILNVISNFILAKWMGPSGLALSASLVGMIYSILTFMTLNKISGGFHLKFLTMEYMKIAFATIFMIIILLLLKGTEFMGVLSDWALLAIMIPIGTILFFIALWLCKSRSLSELLVVTRFKKK